MCDNTGMSNVSSRLWGDGRVHYSSEHALNGYIYTFGSKIPQPIDLRCKAATVIAVTLVNGTESKAAASEDDRERYLIKLNQI